MLKETVVFVLLSIVIISVTAQCSCQNKPPVGGGEASECTCGRNGNLPKITEHRDAHYDYGFTIENPKQPNEPAEVRYSFDFHMDKPKPPPSSETLATYAFEMKAPPQKKVESEPRYNFDFQVQAPVRRTADDKIEGLQTRVELPPQKIVEQSPRYAFDYQFQVPVNKASDRTESKSCACKCNCNRPTIDDLQSCPKHGHLYQSGGPLHPSNQQRYNQESNLPQPIRQKQVSVSVDRSKRDINNQFPIRILPLLPRHKLQNQIEKQPTVEDEEEKRIAEIMIKNFGVDPRVDNDELLRPKHLSSVESPPSESDVVQDEEVLEPIKLKTPKFIEKMRPKFQQARANMDDQISKMVNKARLNTILFNKMMHKIQKRSTESDLAYFKGDDAENLNEPLGPEEPSNESGNVNPNSRSCADGQSICRIRKHCDRCGELAKKFPCPSCAELPLEHSQPQYVEIKNGNPIAFVPSTRKHVSNKKSEPRFVFDRLGQRYVENNGNFRLLRPKLGQEMVGNYHNEPDAMGELEDILDRNSAIIRKGNLNSVGHIVQPMGLAEATDALRFIHELTEKHGNQHNEDYYTTSDSYVVGDSQKSPLAKRSFKITPLAEDEEDGSVVVKISPTERKGKKIFDSEKKVYTKTYAVDRDPLTTQKTQAKVNIEKVTRDGKQYEILALSEDGSDVESVESEEDVELLKYIYAANHEHFNQEMESGEAMDMNNAKNDETRMGLQIET